MIDDVMRQLSFDETKVDGVAGFSDVESSGIDSYGLSHDESFTVDDLDLKVILTVDLNVPQSETQEDVLVFKDPMFEVPNDHVVNESDTHGDVERGVDVGRTEENIVEQVRVEEVLDGSFEKDVVHGIGEEVDYDVDRMDNAYEAQYHVESSEDAGTDDDDDDDKDDDFLVDEENEIVKPEVEVHLFGISKNVPFDNISVTSLVLDDLLEEDVDVVNLDGLDSDPGNDNETTSYMRRRLHELRREMKGVINANGRWK
ncbi:hypothetical protein Tco_0146434 [Tanacetum coccineum]